MNKFEELSEEDKKDWAEVTIKIPKNTLCLIVNYIETQGSKTIMGNIQLDSDDIKEIIKNERRKSNNN